MVHAPSEIRIPDGPPVTRELPKVAEAVHVVGRTVEPEFVTSELPPVELLVPSNGVTPHTIAGDTDDQYEESHMAEVSSVNVVETTSSGFTTTEVPVPLPEVGRTLSAEEEAELGGDDDVPPAPAPVPEVPTEPVQPQAEELPVAQAEAVEGKKKPKKSGRGS
jgi:hypothetical protein